MRVYAMRSVSILTEITKKRHLIGVALLLAMLALFVPSFADAADSRWHPIREITAVAENYLKLTIGPSDDRIVPTAGHLDPRLHLPLCSVALDPYLTPGAKVTGRTIVGVRCSGSKPWKIYLPVYVAVMEDVVIAQSAIQRDYLIRPEDVTLEKRDVSGLAGGYLSRISDIVGHRLKQSVAPGVVIVPALLRAEVLVKRGQTVTLFVRNDSLNIRMSGKALMDGASDQRIRVENTVSGRIVEGLVRSAERVEVLIY